MAYTDFKKLCEPSSRRNTAFWPFLLPYLTFYFSRLSIVYVLRDVHLASGFIPGRSWCRHFSASMTMPILARISRHIGNIRYNEFTCGFYWQDFQELIHLNLHYTYCNSFEAAMELSQAQNLKAKRNMLLNIYYVVFLFLIKNIVILPRFFKESLVSF